MIKKKSIIYVRVSTEEQTKGYSLDAQEDEDREFSLRLGYEPIKIFREEGRSAKDLKRPVLKQMLQWGRENKEKFDAVIFWKWERISRGTEQDYAELSTFFQECNVHPLSVTECNEESPEGELLRWMTKGMNLYELRKISQRTKLGMNKICRLGRKPAKAPIGYINYTHPDNSKSIIVDEVNAPFIKKAFELYASGSYSMKRLGKELFLDGFTNKRGEPYPPRKFEEILKNVFYVGKFMWSGILYEGTHEPLVSRELFDAVQAKFGLKKPKSHDIFFPYTNLIKCSHCGHNLSAEMKRGAHNSGEYIYYRCKCGNVKAIKQEELDIEFMRMLDDLYIPPQEIEILKDGAKEILEAIKEYENKIETPLQIQEKIEKINERIKKSYKDKLDGNIPSGLSDDDWQEMIQEWAAEKDRLIVKLNERMQKSKILYDKLNLLIMFCNHLPELYRVATPQMKREVIQTCVRTLTYDGKNLIIELFPLFYEFKKWKMLKMGRLIVRFPNLPLICLISWKIIKINTSSQKFKIFLKSHKTDLSE